MGFSFSRTGSGTARSYPTTLAEDPDPTRCGRGYSRGAEPGRGEAPPPGSGQAREAVGARASRRDPQRESQLKGQPMITKFDSLYAGHIDMDDIGYGGTAVNSRVFSNDQLVTVFAKARNLARLLDRCGYDTFWLAEHHFQREGYECIPNVLLLALDLAHQTERL